MAAVVVGEGMGAVDTCFCCSEQATQYHRLWDFRCKMGLEKPYNP